MSESANGAVVDDQVRQRARALAKANGVRIARAKIRRRLKGGELGLAEALEVAPGSTPVAELLEALPVNARSSPGSRGARPSKARALAAGVIELAGIDPAATVLELSAPERVLVLRALPDRYRPGGLAPLIGEGPCAVEGVRGLRSGIRAGDLEAERTLRVVVGALRFYAEGGEGPRRAHSALAELGAIAGAERG